MRHVYILAFVTVMAIEPFYGTASAWAEDVAGSKDHPLITRYPGSTISKYSAKAFDEYELALAKANPDGKLEKSQHLEGKVTLIVYTLPEGRSTLEIFRNYESALTRAGFTPLFTCKGNEGPGSCGPLDGFLHQIHDWGPSGEDKQRYLAAKLSRGEGDVFIALHVDPASALLDVVETKAMETGLVTVDAAALAGDISRTGHVAIYGIHFDTGKADVKPDSESTLKEIAKLLQQNGQLKLHVIGHTDNVGDLAKNMDLSRRRAQSVMQALTVKHGVAAARLRADGVGPLAPVASNKAEDGRAQNRRVELVEQ